MTDIRLDDLYKMVAHIYSEQNLSRSPASTFAHFVEVCGMLTIHDRKKKREGVTVTDALCKALGWYFPLLAKLRVRSVEEIIFRKFPYVCPYCRQQPHRDAECKLVRGTRSTVDHDELLRFSELNRTRMPKSLNQWQGMFQEIYPREADDRGRSTIGLLEELGELGEAVRVFDRHPKYFAGEAADTFSYLMGIANEHSLRLAQEEEEEFSFQAEFLKRYPGLCTQCGSKVCVCPAVPEATVGRMAKELDISAGESLFVENPQDLSDEGRRVAHIVLELVGGYQGLVARFPFDRGDANKALMITCLRIADAVQASRRNLAEKLRAEAVRIGESATYAGSPREPFEVTTLLGDLKDAWRQLGSDLKSELRATGGLVEELADIIGTIHVLFVQCGPSDADPIRGPGELRAIRESVRLGKASDNVTVEQLPAATIDDLRRELLSQNYEIVHFSGHADKDNLVFETSEGKATEAPLSAVLDLLGGHESIKCVILNACESAKSLTTAACPYVVGMEENVDDEAAIEFARGFYDALAAGKNFDFAIEEGRHAVRLKGYDDRPITVLKNPGHDHT